MNKIELMLLVICILAICGCDNKATYRPSGFPVAKEKREISFSIPYEDSNGAMKVRVRLNGGPQYDGTWDSGCSLPLKISSLEATQLVKEGTLSDRDYIKSYPVEVANGQNQMYDVYKLKSISFTDDKGEEHTLKDIPAVIDDNAGTDILIGLPVMQSLGYAHEISQIDNLIMFKE